MLMSDLGSALSTQGWPREQGQVPCLYNKGYPSRFAAPRSFDFPSFQVLQNRSFWTCEELWRNHQATEVHTTLTLLDLFFVV